MKTLKFCLFTVVFFLFTNVSAFAQLQWVINECPEDLPGGGSSVSYATFNGDINAGSVTGRYDYDFTYKVTWKNNPTMVITYSASPLQSGSLRNIVINGYYANYANNVITFNVNYSVYVQNMLFGTFTRNIKINLLTRSVNY